MLYERRIAIEDSEEVKAALIKQGEMMLRAHEAYMRGEFVEATKESMQAYTERRMKMRMAAQQTDK